MEKIKQFLESNAGKDVLTILIIILVGLASFGLGRLSKNDKNPGVEIEYLEESESAGVGQTGSAIKALEAPRVSQGVQGGAFFASSRGSKYYSIGCSGGKDLKPENKIYFNTEAEAISAGYEKSSTCK